MGKHGGNGGKGKIDTTEDGAKISVLRARARIDDKNMEERGARAGTTPLKIR